MPPFLQTNSLTGCVVPASRASAILLHIVLQSRLTGVCGMSVELLDDQSSIGVDYRLMPQRVAHTFIFTHKVSFQGPSFSHDSLRGVGLPGIRTVPYQGMKGIVS